ncbi:hypothetical protein F2981_32160 (plasmid) [Sinorhizobium meliloti]|nr:hypothetical protein [Sinorhizobium meliloti]
MRIWMQRCRTRSSGTTGLERPLKYSGDPTTRKRRVRVIGWPLYRAKCLGQVVPRHRNPYNYIDKRILRHDLKFDLGYGGRIRRQQRLQ